MDWATPSERGWRARRENILTFCGRGSHRQTEAERRRFLALEERRNARAAALAIDPTLIASRATLLALAHNWEFAAAGLMAWQKQILDGLGSAFAGQSYIVSPHDH